MDTTIWPLLTDSMVGYIYIPFPNSSARSNNHIKQCRTLFMNYEAPDEFSSDGGPQFTSSAFTLQTWNTHHCILI